MEYNKWKKKIEDILSESPIKYMLPSSYYQYFIQNVIERSSSDLDDSVLQNVRGQILQEFNNYVIGTYMSNTLLYSTDVNVNIAQLLEFSRLLEFANIKLSLDLCKSYLMIMTN